MFVDTTLALANRGHTVQAICHPSFIKRKCLEEKNGVTVVCVAPLNQYDWLAMLRIRFALKRFEPDVAHFHLNRAAKLGGRAATSAGIPWVGTFHNYYSVSNYANAALIFAVSSDVQRHVIAQGFPSQQVPVVPNFSRLYPAEQVRTRTGTPIRILSYGRFVHKKGFDVLLKAFKGLLNSGIDAELILGGDGPDAGLLSTLCEELELHGRVTFKAWIEDVQQELDRADLFVLPSRDEPFGVVMLEAMARGVPVITTQSRGAAEVLSNESAFFVALDSVEALTSALETSIRSPKLASEKAAVALQCYRTKYSEDAVLPQIETLYYQIGRTGRQTSLSSRDLKNDEAIITP